MAIDGELQNWRINCTASVNHGRRLVDCLDRRQPPANPRSGRPSVPSPRYCWLPSPNYPSSLSTVVIVLVPLTSRMSHNSQRIADVLLIFFVGFPLVPAALRTDRIFCASFPFQVSKKFFGFISLRGIDSKCLRSMRFTAVKLDQYSPSLWGSIQQWLERKPTRLLIDRQTTNQRRCCVFQENSSRGPARRSAGPGSSCD